MAERQMMFSRTLLSAAAAATAIIGAGGTAWSANNPGGFDRGNPLWGIKIESLQATRERPLFSPSRRAPVAATIAAPEALPPPPPPPPPPDRPALDLLGTVTGNGVGYAVFLDGATHDIVRLKTGEGQDGWILQSVKNREAVLVKDDRTAVMRLASPLGGQ
jgi:general secretion pathway protein N